MSATDTFTLRVCITGLCLVVPDNQRLVVMMPRTGPGTVEPMQHRARLRCDIANLTPNNTGSGYCEIDLDGPPFQISDPYPPETYTWKSEKSFLDLTRVYSINANAAWLSDVSGKLLSCAVTMPMGNSGCAARGNLFEVEGQIQNISWVVRRDITLPGSSVDIAGRTLYPVSGVLDVTLANEPDVEGPAPGVGNSVPHFRTIYALMGIGKPVPRYAGPDGTGGSCPGYIAKPATRTDAFQCMPSFATT